MRNAIGLLLGLLLQAQAAHAQETTRLIPDGIAIGGTVGALMFEGGSLLAGSLHVNRLKAHRVGMAFDLAFPPQVLEYGLLLFPDLGVAYNVSAPGTTFLFKAGGSAMVGIGGGIYPGANVGLAVITAPDGLLVEATEHWYWSEGSAQSVFSIGVGFTTLPKVGK